MALSQATLDAIAAAVTAAVAQAFTPAQSSTAAPKAATPTRSADGRDFPCTAAEPCSRSLRSAKRAAIHGVDAGGHTAR